MKPSERDLERAKRLIVEACVNTCEHTYIRPENVYECIAEALANERASLPKAILDELYGMGCRICVIEELEAWQKGEGPEPRKAE